MLGKKLRTEDDRIKAAAKARKKKRKKMKMCIRDRYYAAIVIPDNFSESLLSILSGDIKQPKLDYYINEKKNAIAPKITDTGASTIQQEDVYKRQTTKYIFQTYQSRKM